MKKLFTLIVAVGLVIGISSFAISATLVDVPSGHWAEDAVQKLLDAGMVEGYPDGTYKGDRPITRYEYAMVVARMMDMLDKSYCLKSECKDAPAAAEAGPCKCDIDAAQLDEIKSIVKKLAAEFKDELAALKVKVDENSTKIARLENKIDKAFLGKLAVTGSIRQRMDVPNTDLSDTLFVDGFYEYQYGVPDNTVAKTGLSAGYEMVPQMEFTGEVGDNASFLIGMDYHINNMANLLGDNDPLGLYAAYVDLDFSETVRELDVLKIRSGYQQLAFGPYGMLVDNSGLDSSAGIMLDVGKDLVSVSAFGGLIRVTDTGSNPGIGSSAKDAYAAFRLGLDLPFVDLGVNYLGSGLVEEKGWGVDIVAPLLQDSPFLNELRAEYMTVTDLDTGLTPGADKDDASFVIGLDIYKNKRAGVTLSYADIPAAVALTSLDSNPFTEYDQYCPLGLDVKPSTGQCSSFESGRMLFPAGFEGLGVEANYTVLGNVELAAKAVVGNYAGGNVGAVDLDGEEYPGFGAFSVTKPINSDSKFRVEYMQQGLDPILLNRVRGELLINF